MSTNFLTCSNKGCYSQDYHKLDVDTGDVICVDCGQTVEVSSYMKKTLESSGQVFKRAKSNSEKLCPACKETGIPCLLDYGKDLVEAACRACGAVNDHLTNYFIEAIKLNPQVERIEVMLTKSEDQDDAEAELVRMDGKKFPWNDPKAKSLTQEELKKQRRDKEREERKAWKARILAREAAAMQPVIIQQAPVAPKVAGAARRSKPMNVQAMLERAGIKYTGDYLNDDDDEGFVEEAPRRVIKKAPNKKGPRSAAEMLERAGVPLATPDPDPEEVVDTSEQS